MKILKFSVIYLPTLQCELQVEEKTWRIRISKPAPWFQSLLKIRISTCNNIYFFALLKSIFLFPFIIVSTMRKWSEFSSFLFNTFLLLGTGRFFIRLFIILIFWILDFLFGGFGLFFFLFIYNLVVINPIQDILFNSINNEFLEILFKLLFFLQFNIFLVLFVFALLFYLFNVLIVLLLEILYGFWHVCHFTADLTLISCGVYLLGWFSS